MEVVLQKMAYGLQRAISTEFLDYFAHDPRVRVERNPFFLDVIATIRLDLLVDKLETKEVKYPATWRDAFKERWFPGWLKARYPIKYVCVKLEARAIYPKIKIPRDMYECVVHITKEVWHESRI